MKHHFEVLKTYVQCYLLLSLMSLQVVSSALLNNINPTKVDILS